MPEQRARVLLIRRKAMVLLGLPVATYDYDRWIHFDDIEKLNDARHRGVSAVFARPDQDQGMGHARQ
jgi:hypothetical protein